jgi:hypothetical protein
MIGLVQIRKSEGNYLDGGTGKVLSVVKDADEEDSNKDRDIQRLQKDNIRGIDRLKRPDSRKKVGIEKWILRLRWSGG